MGPRFPGCDIGLEGIADRGRGIFRGDCEGAAVVLLNGGFFTGQKVCFRLSEKETLQGYLRKNIVWQYFVKKKKTFSEIVAANKLIFNSEPLFLQHKI